MTEYIGLTSSNGVFSVAVSEPFQLFSDSDVVMEEYSYASDIAPKQLGGYARK